MLLTAAPFSRHHLVLYIQDVCFFFSGLGMSKLTTEPAGEKVVYITLGADIFVDL